MSFVDAIRAGYAHYFSIGGRASRAEYWWFVLYTVIAMLMIGMAAVLAAVYLGGGRVALAEQVTIAIYVVGFLVPLMTTLVRRLHDIGRSGWWVLVATVLPQLAGSGFLVSSSGTPPVTNATAQFSWPTTIANLMSLTVLVMSVWPSQKRDNKYGPAPVMPGGSN